MAVLIRGGPASGAGKISGNKIRRCIGNLEEVSLKMKVNKVFLSPLIRSLRTEISKENSAGIPSHVVKHGVEWKVNHCLLRIAQPIEGNSMGWQILFSITAG